MAIPPVSDLSEVESSPMLDDSVVADYKSRPVNGSKSGGWRSALFIIGVEMAERSAYYGINSNLISYLTGPLGQSKATAAENVNVWSGVSYFLPLLGGFVADSFLGRYATIILASLLYILGLGLLSLCAVLHSFSSRNCQRDPEIFSCSPPQFQVIFFFFSLYLVAVAQGLHKPCVQAFGADQFDVQDSEERKAKSSYFNWWFLGSCLGPALALLFLNYIQDNLNWGIAFGISCIYMAVAFILFLIGTRRYRYSTKGEYKNPFLRISKVFTNAVKSWQTSSSAALTEPEGRKSLPRQSSQQFTFLSKPLLKPADPEEVGRECRIGHTGEQAKLILGLIPIGVTCLAYAIIIAQVFTFFVEQGITMDRRIWSGLEIPAASLQLFSAITIVIFVPIYDRIFVPLARSIFNKPSGITLLQRIGAGIFFSIISMVVAALVETKRLETAVAYGLVDFPKATIPMSVWWLVPQYLFLGVADVLAVVGMQELFYDQMPSELKSIGLALYLSVIGMGNFLSSILVSVIDKVTSADGEHSWFSDNLNRAHLDYFFWLLAGLGSVALLMFLFFAKSIIYSSQN